jgi:hypothetical protein
MVMKKTLKESKLAKGVFENYIPSIALQLYTVILETGVALLSEYTYFLIL